MTATDADRAKAAEVTARCGFHDRELDDAIAAALAEVRSAARRDQQLWDRRRVEEYAAVVGVQLTPGHDLGDAINDLYLAARAPYDRLTADLRALAEELDRADELVDVAARLRAVVAAVEEPRR